MSKRAISVGKSHKGWSGRHSIWCSTGASAGYSSTSIKRDVLSGISNRTSRQFGRARRTAESPPQPGRNRAGVFACRRHIRSGSGHPCRFASVVRSAAKGRGWLDRNRSATHGSPCRSCACSAQARWSWRNIYQRSALTGEPVQNDPPRPLRPGIAFECRR